MYWFGGFGIHKHRSDPNRQSRTNSQSDTNSYSDASSYAHAHPDPKP